MPSRARPIWTVLVMGALCALICVVDGCRTGRKDATPVAGSAVWRGGTLHVRCEPPNDLDPVSIDEVYESVVLRQIYQGLLRFDPSLRILPCLAASWTISPDGLRYTFNLRTGVQFHDGSTLTARDVVFSLDRCLAHDRDGQSLAATYLLTIRGARAYHDGHALSVDGIRASDDHTVVIELERPCPVLLKVLAMDQTVVISRAAFESGGTDQLEHAPVGSGPFRFIRRRPDNGVLLARFDGFWETPAALDTISFQPLKESGKKGAKEAEALERNELQLAPLSTGTSARARELGLSIYRCPELSLSFLGLRLDRPPFDIPQVRRAALLAIRREPLREVDPEGIVPVFGLLPPGMPGREPVDRMPRTDPAEARRLLVEAGHPRGRGLPQIKLGTSRGSQAIEKITQGIRADLESIGLSVVVVPCTWRQLDSLTTRGDLQAFMMSWVADLPDPDAFLYPICHTNGESNLFGYSSTEVDSLLALGRVLVPGPERNAVYAKLQDLLLRDVPLIPLYHSSIAYAWRPEVHGVEIGPSGFAMINFSQIYIDPPELARSQEERQ